MQHIDLQKQTINAWKNITKTMNHQGCKQLCG